jgi:hypothetical protein
MQMNMEDIMLNDIKSGTKIQMLHDLTHAESRKVNHMEVQKKTHIVIEAGG